METFSMLLALCEGNPPVTGGFPSQRPVMWSFDIFLDVCLNKQLSKHSTCQWVEMPLHWLWRHCNDILWTHKRQPVYQPWDTWCPGAMVVSSLETTGPVTIQHQSTCFTNILFLYLWMNFNIFWIRQFLASHIRQGILKYRHKFALSLNWKCHFVKRFFIDCTISFFVPFWLRLVQLVTKISLKLWHFHFIVISWWIIKGILYVTS